ncbi:MAG: hypothetical protein ACLFUG_10705 [Nitriliruptoraceae bacterium]
MIPFNASPDQDSHDRRTCFDELPALEAVLRTWIQGRARPDIVLIDPDRGVQVSLDELLRELRASSTPLGTGYAASLGLPADATVGEAAAALLAARHDVDGPRCRSFRSASYFLNRLPPIAAIDADGEQESEVRPHADA